ncbi:hypothetical protein Tco_0114102, partial [Tanacetum coccineum]
MPGPLVISVLNAKKHVILLTNVERKLLMSQNKVNGTKMNLRIKNVSSDPNMFLMRKRINQVIVNVIIDGGSSENIISRDIVSRLKLASQKHLTPYKAGWIKSLDMDACYVLLGRPWQFDLGVIHKGKENTYTFLKDGKKFTLCPFSREDRPKVTKEKAITILLCSREAFLAE